jgi:glycosyltransferase involved in cell wall biosynthesis
MPNFRRFWRTLPAAVRLQTHYLGVLADAEKPDFYAALDVFALPSRSDSFGLVLLEAWANGLPCIGYRAGGVAEVIRHDEDGVLVPCGDVTALSHQLTCLVEDAAMRQRLGHCGAERIQREHRWEEKLAIVEEVYRQLAR